MFQLNLHWLCGGPDSHSVTVGTGHDLCFPGNRIICPAGPDPASWPGAGGGGRHKGGAGSMHPEHVNGTKVIPLPETNASCVAGELKNR